MKGTVVRLNSDKGYGFIKGEDGNDYFVHHSSCLARCFNELTPTSTVVFEPEEGEKGLRAVDVEIQ